MKLAKLALTVVGAWFTTCSMAQAATQNATGCPAGAWTTWGPGQTVSISWSFQGVPGVIAFQPTQIRYGGAIAPLTPAQAQAYAPTLDNLRAAAQARRKVTVYWDSVTNVVSTIIVRWDQPC
jgi:hypothetical protein